MQKGHEAGDVEFTSDKRPGVRLKADPIAGVSRSPEPGLISSHGFLSRAKALGLRSLNIADEGASHISKGREDKLTFGSLSVMPFLTP
jgi:hypothetical protein